MEVSRSAASSPARRPQGPGAGSNRPRDRPPPGNRGRRPPPSCWNSPRRLPQWAGYSSIRSSAGRKRSPGDGRPQGALGHAQAPLLGVKPNGKAENAHGVVVAALLEQAVETGGKETAWLVSSKLGICSPPCLFLSSIAQNGRQRPPCSAFRFPLRLRGPRRPPYVPDGACKTPSSAGAGA